jgi:hypothetical protein
MFGNAITGRAYRTIVPLAVRCRSGVAMAAPERHSALERVRPVLREPAVLGGPVGAYAYAGATATTIHRRTRTAMPR